MKQDPLRAAAASPRDLFPSAPADLMILFVLTTLLMAMMTLRLHADPVEGLPGSWQLAWSDEFKQPDGTKPDPTKWRYDTGGNGFGNNEREYYTDRTNNVRIENGQLIIEARSEQFHGKHYTSGRILTNGKFSATYGLFEARIKIPRGQGIWPAFWMMGTSISSNSWPNCGEIDIMENIGREPGTVHGTVHGPGYSGDHGIGKPVSLPDNAVVADNFHVFAVDCEPGSVTWFMDGKKYFSITPASLPQGAAWVFDKPKFVLLNLAVGGYWPGYPDATSSYPQRMVVDYVRVYQKSLLAQVRQLNN
jgi:beta-glucanase (GH16 family)